MSRYVGGVNPIFDFDNDGSVSVSDFIIQFRLRFGGIELKQQAPTPYPVPSRCASPVRACLAIDGMPELR